MITGSFVESQNHRNSDYLARLVLCSDRMVV